MLAVFNVEKKKVRWCRGEGQQEISTRKKKKNWMIAVAGLELKTFLFHQATRACYLGMYCEIELQNIPLMQEATLTSPHPELQDPLSNHNVLPQSPLEPRLWTLPALLDSTRKDQHNV